MEYLQEKNINFYVRKYVLPSFLLSKMVAMPSSYKIIIQTSSDTWYDFLKL